MTEDTKDMFVAVCRHGAEKASLDFERRGFKFTPEQILWANQFRKERRRERGMDGCMTSLGMGTVNIVLLGGMLQIPVVGYFE